MTPEEKKKIDDAAKAIGNVATVIAILGFIFLCFIGAIL